MTNHYVLLILLLLCWTVSPLNGWILHSQPAVSKFRGNLLNVYSLIPGKEKDLLFNQPSTIFRLQEWQKKAFSLLCVFIISSSIPFAAKAAVGEGDLPEGVQAFSRLLNAKSDFAKVESTIEKRAKEFSIDEQLGLQVFYKRFANDEFEDMKLLSRGILDEGKRKEANEVAKQIRKYMIQFDNNVSDDKYDDIIREFPKCKQLIDHYFELLQDVPDEI